MSTQVRFYHLQVQPVERALPQILSKILATGQRAVVRLPDAETVRYFNTHLWTYTPESFLPHGIKTDAQSDAAQPVFLTDGPDNPNKAGVLVLYNCNTVPENIADFSMCCDFLNGQDDDAVSAARQRWKAYKEAGCEVTYWQQTDQGGWEQKA